MQKIENEEIFTMAEEELEIALYAASENVSTSYKSIDCLNLGLWLGFGLMSNGAETIRVEDSVTRILSAYDLVNAEVFAVSNYLHVSALSSSGEPISFGKRMRGSSSNNLDKVDRLNDLARRITSETPDPVLTLNIVKQIIDAPGYPFIIHAFAVSLSAFAFALLLGSDLVPALWATTASFIMINLLRPVRKHYANPIFINIIGSVLITLLIWPVRYTIYSADSLLMMTASFMYFFPGIALINSTRDLMAGDYSAGLAKMIEVLLLAASVAVGSGATLAFLGRIWPIA
ncbi:MAG: threonine/serine exporter family protein [Eubacteriales bacterium]|nr:threonine/serine exporter family protein [Eubacteriales bacterium]